MCNRICLAWKSYFNHLSNKFCLQKVSPLIALVCINSQMINTETKAVDRNCDAGMSCRAYVDVVTMSVLNIVVNEMNGAILRKV